MVEIRLAWHPKVVGASGGNERGKVEEVAFLLLVFFGAFENTNSKGAQWFFFNKKNMYFKRKGKKYTKKMMSHGISILGTKNIVLAHLYRSIQVVFKKKTQLILGRGAWTKPSQTNIGSRGFRIPT